MATLHHNFDANETSTAVQYAGPASIYMSGTWGSGSLVLQTSHDNVTWFDVTTDDMVPLVFTANANVVLPIYGQFYLRGTLSGATTPSVNVHVVNDAAPGLSAPTLLKAFTGNATSDALTINGDAAVQIVATSYGSGALTFELSHDGITWSSLTEGGSAVSYTSGSDRFKVASGGIAYIRAILSGSTSPTLSVYVWNVGIASQATAAAILEDTGTDGVVVNTHTTAAKAELQTEANDALVDNNLDHLMKVAVTGGDVTDNSALAKLVSKSATADWDTFANTTDSQEAIRDGADTNTTNVRDDISALDENLFNRTDPQWIADAGKTAPSAGSPAPGSVHKKLDDLPTDVTVVALADKDDESVPPARTIVLVQTSAGLVGEAEETIKVGDTVKFAVDFRNDMAANDRFQTLESPAIASGTAGGLTFATPGRDRSQIKCDVTAVTAGTYEVTFAGTYKSASGPRTGTVTFTAVA